MSYKIPDAQLTANQAVHYAVKTGRIVKPRACSRCGISGPPRRLHAHHEDYGRPLDVTWLCPHCHGGRHAEIRVPHRHRRAGGVVLTLAQRYVERLEGSAA